MSDAPLRVTLELEPASEPLKGAVCEPGGRRRPFDGWLGLTSALEATLAAARSAAGEEPEE